MAMRRASHTLKAFTRARHVLNTRAAAASTKAGRTILCAGSGPDMVEAMRQAHAAEEARAGSGNAAPPPPSPPPPPPPPSAADANFGAPPRLRLMERGMSYEQASAVVAGIDEARARGLAYAAAYAAAAAGAAPRGQGEGEGKA